MELTMTRELPALSRSKEAELTGAIGSWAFSGHDFSEEELTHAACLMLQHALRLPELEKWRLSTGKPLTNFGCCL